MENKKIELTKQLEVINLEIKTFFKDLENLTSKFNELEKIKLKAEMSNLNEKQKILFFLKKKKKFDFNKDEFENISQKIIEVKKNLTLKEESKKIVSDELHLLTLKDENPEAYIIFKEKLELEAKFKLTNSETDKLKSELANAKVELEKVKSNLEKVKSNLKFNIQKNN